MSVPIIQEDSLGTTVKVTLTNIDGSALDLTDATISFIFKSPVGVRTTKDGDAYGDPVNGIAVYSTETGDLDSSGSWSVQVRAEYSVSEVYFSQVGKIKVKANL